MGIQGLWSYLTKNHYDAFVSISDDLSSFQGQTWAIDVSIYMYKFGSRPTFISEFIEQASRLQQFGIKPIYIFDGKRHPAKRYEHMRRREQAVRSVENLSQRKELIRRLENDPAADQDTIRSWVAELGTSDVQKTFSHQAVLRVDGVDDIELKVDSERLVAAVRDREPRPQIHIPDTHYEELMFAFESANVPFYIAVGDAEKCGAHLCRTGQIDALVTDDGDALVFGATVVIRNLFRGGKTGMELVKVPELLTKMDLTAAQFVDLAIICGCDYTECRGLPGIGPAKAIKLLKTYGSLTSYFQSLEWIARQTMLNFDMGRLQYVDAMAMFLDISPQIEYSSKAIDPNTNALCEMV